MKRTKLITAVCVLTVVLLLGLFTLPTTAQAATSGDYTYEVSNGKATITSYTGPATDLTIPSVLGGYPVTAIGDHAFQDYGITGVTIPDSVTSIGEYAFVNCGSLTSVTIPDSVKSIGHGAFDECSGLASVTIGNSVTSIGDSAFYNCNSLTSVTIPDSVTSIGSSAFTGCIRLASIWVDENNTAYSSDDRGVLFNKDKTVLIQAPGGISVSYTIPDSVTSIGDYAFRSCYSLTSVTIGNSVTSIGDSAFYNCNSLTSVTIGNSVTSIGDSAFSSCDSLTSVTIPDGVTSIGDSAFSSCDSLTSVTIPDSVTSIGNYTFGYCDSLISVTIGNSVTSIGNSAFYWCSSLESVTIGNSVTSIGDHAFSSCDRLKGIWVDEDNAYYSSDSSGALFNKDKTILIRVAEGISGSYTIPDSVTSIGDYACYSCYSLTSVTIPDSVTSIGNYTFRDCTSLKSVTIPDSVTSIGDEAFSSCYNLTSVTIPDSVTSIGEYAFFSCDSLISVTIGNSVTSIGNSAFYWCSSLESVTIGNSVTSIGNYAFSSCDSLTSVTIPDSVTRIGDGAFRDCDSLISVTIGNSVTSIGSSAFTGCTSLAGIWVSENNANYSSDSSGALFNKDKTILIRVAEGVSGSYTIPDSVTSIGDEAFYNCASLTSVIIPDGVTSIGDYAFRSCYRLTSVTIPDGVTSIGDEAFYSCHRLTSVTIPDGVTSIGDEAFCNCYSLTSVTIPDSVTSIGDSAFYNCTSLKSVTIGNSVESIGSYTFYHCYSLIGVTIPDSVTSIGYYAFCSCTSLKSVTIPKSITNIERYAFVLCENLQTVYYGGTEKQWAAIDIKTAGNKLLKNATIYYNHPAHDYTADVKTCSICGYVRDIGTITGVALRASCAGMYFKGSFDLDEAVAVSRYGIAVSLYNRRPVADDSDATSLYTVGENSVLISNILDSSDGADMIYARTYVLLEDGTYIYGNVVATSLQFVVEGVDEKFASLTTAQQTAVSEMYNRFFAVMSQWNLHLISGGKLCPHCDAVVQWAVWDGESSDTGHFFMTESIRCTSAVVVKQEKDFVLDLNGYTITADGCRAFYISGGATLSIVDSADTGVITGGNSGGDRGGNIYATNGNLNLYGGHIYGGTATDDGNNEGHDVAVYKGSFLMDGNVTIGQDYASGHSLYLFQTTAAQLLKGKVVGKAFLRGTSIALNSGLDITDIAFRNGSLTEVAQRSNAQQINIEIINSSGTSLKGVFTEALENADIVVTYFKPADQTKQLIVNEDGCLEIA